MGRSRRLDVDLEDLSSACSAPGSAHGRRV